MPRVALSLTNTPPGTSRFSFSADVAKAMLADTSIVALGLDNVGGVATTTFNVKTQYGAVGNGTTDDSAAIHAAFDAAHLNSRYGAHSTVLFPAGTYRVNTPWTMPAIRTNDWYGQTSPTPGRAGIILLSGYGATIKYDAIASGQTRTTRFCWLQAPNPGGNWTTYGNLVIEGFTFDNSYRVPSADCGTIIWIQGPQTNTDNITIRDCTTTHVTDRTTSTQNGSIEGIYLHSTQVNRAQAHTSYITRVTVDGCNIQAQGKPIAILCPGTGETTLGLNKVLVDQILVNDTVTDNHGFCGTGIHLGSYASGLACAVTNCTCTDSTDNLIEIDAFNNVVVSGCNLSYAPSGVGFTWFSYPYSTAMPSYVVDDCHYTGGHNPYWPRAVDGVEYTNWDKTRSAAAFGTVVLGAAGTELAGRKWGDFHFTHCTSVQGGYDIANSACPATLRGPLNTAEIHDIDFTDTDSAPRTTQIEVRQSSAGGTLPLAINECRYSTGGAFAAMTAARVYLTGNRTLTTDIAGLV